MESPLASSALPSFDDLGWPWTPPVWDQHLLAVFGELRRTRLWDRSLLRHSQEFRWRAFGAYLSGTDPQTGEGDWILEVLETDTHPFVRACAAWALGERTGLDPDLHVACQALEERVTQDKAWAVGRKAALSLGKRLGEPALLELWRKWKDDPLQAWVRRGVVQAMGAPGWSGDQMRTWLAGAGPEDREALAFLMRDRRPWGDGVEALLRDMARQDKWIATLLRFV